MKFVTPTSTELRGAILAGLIVIEVLLVCFACLQVYMLGRPGKRSRPNGTAGSDAPAAGFTRRDTDARPAAETRAR